jgi:formylglycine-generating enzyme required for sulfatase activity
MSADRKTLSEKLSARRSSTNIYPSWLVVYTVAVACAFASPLRAQDPGAAYVEALPDFSVSFEMIALPGGEVELVALEVDPRDAKKITRHDRTHRVVISPFWIGKYELNWDVAEPWAFPDESLVENFDGLSEHAKVAFMACPTLYGASSDNVPTHDRPGECPLTGLSQFGAKRFCHWLSLATGKFYRLPTEAEWEYACRAGSTTKYPQGDEPSSRVEVEAADDSRDGLRVGAGKPNAWGLCDMLGNVEEWVADGFHEGYGAFSAHQRRVDPIAWPVGRLEGQNEPYLIGAGVFVPPVAELRKHRLRGRWERSGHSLDDRALIQLRRDFLRAGQTVAIGPGVARGGSDNPVVCPTTEHLAFAMRFQPDRNPDTATPDLVFDNSIYWNEGLFRNDVGFRVVRPAKVPSRQVQLWHWGIYEHHEFWSKYTMEPTD